MKLNPGTLLDRRYRIESTFKYGATSVIYLAHDLKLDSDVAIKEFDPDAAFDFGDAEKMRRRFEQEAYITRQLSHPHIIAIYDFFQENGTCYLVMPYLPDTLEDRLEYLTVPQAVKIMVQICEGLAYAHGFHPDKDSPHVVVHCDIKPNNILFDHDQVKITDFGIAHVPQSKDMPNGLTGVLPFSAGTVLYMPPEQLQGKRDDPRIDVYALGALFYQMLARGRCYLDFDESGADQHKNRWRICQDPPLLERLPSEAAPYVSVLRRALSKNPQDRYANAGEMLEATQRASAPVSREADAQTPVASQAAEVADLEKARQLYSGLKRTFDGDHAAVLEILRLYERGAGNSDLRQIALNGIRHVAALALSADDDGETAWKAWRMLSVHYSQIKPWLVPPEDEPIVNMPRDLEHKLAGLWSSDQVGWADVSDAQAVGFQVFVSKFMQAHASTASSQSYARLIGLAQAEWERMQSERVRPRGLQALLAPFRRALVARPALYAIVLALMLLSCAATYMFGPPVPSTPTPHTPSPTPTPSATRTPGARQMIVTTVAPSNPSPTYTPISPTSTRHTPTPTSTPTVRVIPTLSCTGGQILKEGKCECPPGREWSGKECCQPGYEAKKDGTCGLPKTGGGCGNDPWDPCN